MYFKFIKTPKKKKKKLANHRLDLVISIKYVYYSSPFYSLRMVMCLTVILQYLLEEPQ